VLLIGIHTRPAVLSAKALGLFTQSVDYFGDADLKDAADVSRSIQNQRAYKSSGRIDENYSGRRLSELAEDLEADYTVLTSSANIRRRVVGNLPEKVTKLNDKEFQLKKVRKLGIRVPDFEVVNDRSNAIEAAENLGFPCVLKPVKGAGGRGVILAKTKRDVPEIVERHIVQEYIKGTPISASTLSTKKNSILLSTSDQLLGYSSARGEGFVYCGSVVPCSKIVKKKDGELEELFTKISRVFGVVGWNGVDFVFGEEPVFMELNPRFQGTFDCVERSYKINLLDAHMKACEGELIEQPSLQECSARLTLFAKERCMVRDDLRGLTLDVPLQYSIIERGEPITTIIATGATKKEVLNKCSKTAKNVYERSLSRWSPK
jgi:predicted ATP-grasp superfamily ATP-dependent carboligase